jgi:hypothetical protein
MGEPLASAGELIARPPSGDDIFDRTKGQLVALHSKRNNARHLVAGRVAGVGRLVGPEERLRVNIDHDIVRIEAPAGAADQGLPTIPIAVSKENVDAVRDLAVKHGQPSLAAKLVRAMKSEPVK